MSEDEYKKTERKIRQAVALHIMLGRILELPEKSLHDVACEIAPALGLSIGDVRAYIRFNKEEIYLLADRMLSWTRHIDDAIVRLRER